MIKKVDISKKETKKDELERKINEQVDIVFSIDKKNNPAKHKIESMRLVETLYLYVLEVYKHNRTLLFSGNYNDFGLEIVETGINCIKYYDEKKGNGNGFLSYFMSAWKKECRRANIDESIAKDKGGVQISDRDKNYLLQLEKYLKSKGEHLSLTLHAELVSEQLEISLKKAKEIIILHIMSVNSVLVNDSGEEICATDIVPDKLPNIENIIIEHDRWDELMKEIDKAICQLPKKPESYVLDVLSCDVAGVLLTMNEEYKYDYEFINKKLVKEILIQDKIPIAKDIAKKHGILPQTLSRAYARTIKRIRQMISQKYQYFDKSQYQK